jgi:hydrogenase small subunit
MERMTRRSFLELGARLSALLGLGAAQVPQLAGALEDLARRTPVLWLQGQSCSGCSVSLLNSDPLGADRLLTEYISLTFHQTLSAATGEVAVRAVDRAIGAGDFILAVEGAVPEGMPRACLFGHETFKEQLTRAARAAKAVLAVGTCAAYGGIPAGENNPTGSMAVPAYLAKAGVKTPAILVPGCPAHPDWLLGVVVHVLRFGIPPLDGGGVPRAYFSRLVHDQCPRFADYEREKFAAGFGDEGCLFRLGCQGPLTRADCNLRGSNSGINSCIRAGAPCIGCASPHFLPEVAYPLYTAGGRRAEKGERA